MSDMEIDGKVYREVKYHLHGTTEVRRIVTEVIVDGTEYCRAGDHCGQGVFIQSANWPDVTNEDGEGLYVFENEQRMIPLHTWRSHSR